MNYTILTLFPELFTAWQAEGLLGRALANGHIGLSVQDIRDSATDKHRNVDDTPYGGGAGMVMRVDVVSAALENAKAHQPDIDATIMLTPAGTPLTQKLVENLATKKHLCLLCGRYEGFDARVDNLVTHEISIGDYVLMGGEVAALAILEATARLQPHVLGSAESHREDSHSTGLLDYPEYTRPASYAGMDVPEILTSGHHNNIATWRRQQALKKTLERRPDMLKTALLTTADKAFLSELQKQISKEQE